MIKREIIKKRHRARITKDIKSKKFLDLAFEKTAKG